MVAVLPVVGNAGVAEDHTDELGEAGFGTDVVGQADGVNESKVFSRKLQEPPTAVLVSASDLLQAGGMLAPAFDLTIYRGQLAALTCAIRSWHPQPIGSI